MASESDMSDQDQKHRHLEMSDADDTNVEEESNEDANEEEASGSSQDEEEEVKAPSAEPQTKYSLVQVTRDVKILAKLDHRNILHYFSAWLEQLKSDEIDNESNFSEEDEENDNEDEIKEKKEREIAKASNAKTKSKTVKQVKSDEIDNESNSSEEDEENDDEDEIKEKKERKIAKASNAETKSITPPNKIPEVAAKDLNTKDMIIRAISILNNRKGSTMAEIKDFLIKKYEISSQRTGIITKMMKDAHKNRWLVKNTKGEVNSDSRFMLPSEMEQKTEKNIISHLRKEANTKAAKKRKHQEKSKEADVPHKKKKIQVVILKKPRLHALHY